MSDELIRKTEWLLAQDGVAADDEGILKAPPLDESLVHEVLHILVMDESPGGRDLLGVNLRSDLHREILGEAAVVVCLGAGDLQSVVRKYRKNRSPRCLQVDRLSRFKGSACLLLVDDSRLADQGHIGCGASISDRRLVGIHLDKGVIDPKAGKGGENMLNGLDLRIPLDECRCPFDRLHVVDQSIHNRLVGQIRATEFITVSGGGRVDGECDVSAVMQGAAGEAGGLR